MRVSKYQLPMISDLEQKDPLLVFLRKISKGRLLRVALISFAINGILGVGGGILLSVHYSRLGANFMSFFDIREWPVACYTYLIHYPLVWTYYYWQTDGFLASLGKLEKGGIIGKPKTEVRKTVFLKNILSEEFNKSKKRILPISFLIGFFIFWSLIWFQRGFSSIMLFTDKPITWSHINSFYYWLIWLPLNGPLLGYIIGWVFSRSYTINAYFHQLFTKFEINPVPLHIDECNGLSSIGRYSKVNAYLVGIDYGLWLAAYIAFPLLFSSSVNFNLVTTPYLLVFFFLATPLLLWPSIAAHFGMKYAKKRILNQVGRNLSKLLMQSRKSTSKTAYTELEMLRIKYTMLENELHEWPFPSPGFFSFIFSVIGATIPTILSLLLEIYIRII